MKEKIKFKLFKSLLVTEAYKLAEDAGYVGAHNDGGKERLLGKLRDFTYQLQAKYDLRPSEMSKLDDIEIEIPGEFRHHFNSIKKRYFDQISLQDILNLIEDGRNRNKQN